MDELEKNFKKNKGQVVDLLVDNVLKVKLEVPLVVKGNFD